MAVYCKLPTQVVCDICGERTDAPCDVVLDGMDTKLWKPEWQRKTAQKAAKQVEDTDWLITYGIALCPKCTETVAAGDSTSLFADGGLVGALDHIFLSKRIIKEAKKKVEDGRG